MVCHSHQDAGWIYTIDEFYKNQVDWILNSVTEALEKNHERRYTHGDMMFFQMWWNKQNETKKEIVRK